MPDLLSSGSADRTVVRPPWRCAPLRRARLSTPASPSTMMSASRIDAAIEHLRIARRCVPCTNPRMSGQWGQDQLRSATSS
jgi:hypothetical protein